jgi:hypothetical protein
VGVQHYTLQGRLCHSIAQSALHRKYPYTVKSYLTNDQQTTMAQLFTFIRIFQLTNFTHSRQGS